MHKKNIKLFVIIGAILLCCFFSTVAYSALYSTMDITGVAYARVVKDVRITDFRLNSSSNATSQYEEFGVNTISTKFNLSDSSSSIIFDVEVTNYGSADVGILQLGGNVPTGLSYEIINYNLEDKLCDDSGKCNQMAVKTFQIKFTGTAGEYELTQELDFRTYHTVTYTDITNNGYPTEVIDDGDLNITFTESLKKVFVLSDGIEINYFEQISSGQTIVIENVSNDIEIKKNIELVAKLVSGKIDEVGSEVCIEDECFYIISNDGSTVTMLAKYNLYVGNVVNEDRITTPILDPTGIQDSTAKGRSEEYPWIGTTFFSNSCDHSYSGSIAEGYANEYGDYLLSLGANILNSRLILYDEIISLPNYENLSFLYTSSYWTMSIDDSLVVGVQYTGYIPEDFGCELDGVYGIRPVIEMSVDEIINTIGFTIDGISYRAEENMTWENWIESDYNTGGFTLFKYEISLDDYCYVSDANNNSLYLEDNDPGYNIVPSDLIQSNGNYYVKVEPDESVIPIS